MHFENLKELLAGFQLYFHVLVMQGGTLIWSRTLANVFCFTGGRVWRDFLHLHSITQSIIKVDILAGPNYITTLWVGYFTC